MEEIQDENQEGELQTETKYTEDVPRKKVKYTSQCLTVNKKEVLKHLSHLHSVLLTGEKEKIRQTCVKLKERYTKVMNHFKISTANCNNLTKDDLASVLIPDDFDEIQNPVALKRTGNGNCLYNSISILKCDSEDFSELLCLSTSIELYENAASYVVHEALISASRMLRRKLELLFPDILAITDGQNVWYETFDQMPAIQQEAIAVSQYGKFSSMISVFGLSSIIQQPIFSHYPLAKYNLCKLFNQIVMPLETKSQDILHILWSRYGSLDTSSGRMFEPNHFVPLTGC